MKLLLIAVLACQLLIPFVLRADEVATGLTTGDARVRERQKPDTKIGLYDRRGAFRNLEPADFRSRFNNLYGIETSHQNRANKKSYYQPLNPFVIRW